MTLLVPATVAHAEQPQVVVSVADSGINPYHEVYYRPQHTAHPCTWVIGFEDCSIPALDLSIGEYPDIAQALAADKAVWDAVEPGQWYWIPKTNIIGAVCATPFSDALNPAAASTCIYDDHGHGTGTTSSVLSEAPESLLLFHEGLGGELLGSAPVTADIRSHSVGHPAPVAAHGADAVVPGPNWACNDAIEPETIMFRAAGNEVPIPTVLDCFRASPSMQVVGGGFPGHWSTKSWSVYDFASWQCRPTAAHDSISGMVDSYCGTSFATPTAAGAAAAALLRIRQHDGYGGRNTAEHVSPSVTHSEFIDALRTAATYAPAAKFDNEARPDSELPLPSQAPWLFWGYGWLDSTVADAVSACALGESCPAKSSESLQYNAARRDARAAMTQDLVPAEPQDDAGSGRDAGPHRRTAVGVDPGSAYDARMASYGVNGDVYDRFTFTAQAGQTIAVAFEAVGLCVDVLDPRERLLSTACASPTSRTDVPPATATVDGVYTVSVLSMATAPPEDYRFGIGLDASAPDLG